MTVAVSHCLPPSAFSRWHSPPPRNDARRGGHGKARNTKPMSHVRVGRVARALTRSGRSQSLRLDAVMKNPRERFLAADPFASTKCLAF